MSSWVDSAKWAKYLSKEGCPVCNQTPETRPPAERLIADLRVTRFIADRDTCLKGHCCLVLKPHVIEIYDLSDEDSTAFMCDVRVASLALKNVTGAVKLNYEIHGNTIPHMHMHLWPRQIGDRFENGPIDWRSKTPKTYEDGEFEAFIERMKTGILDRFTAKPTVISHKISSTSFLRHARGFLEALRLLAAAPKSPPAAATALLAAHSLEIGLKAFLLQIGWDEKRVKSLGHDLVKAWRCAQQNGLPVAADPPRWYKTLSSAHDKPFIARYARNNTGLVVPAIAELVRDIGGLLDQVGREIVNRGGTV